MNDELTDDLDPGELDPFLIAQAARIRARRAEEIALANQHAIGVVDENMWTRLDQEGFLEVARESYRRAMHRIAVLLTFSVVALVLVLGLLVAENVRSSREDKAVDHRVDTLIEIATESCERNNAQLDNTRRLYGTLARTTSSPQVAGELAAAADRLPDPVDCTKLQELNH